MIKDQQLGTRERSLAWSYAARREPPLDDCESHRNCANCRTYANAWRTRLLHQLATTPVQPSLWEVASA